MGICSDWGPSSSETFKDTLIKEVHPTLSKDDSDEDPQTLEVPSPAHQSALAWRSYVFEASS